MKTVSVRDLQKKIRECVDVAQGERIVVTRRGRPAAVLVGVEGQDWEDIALRLNPAFWTMIEERRREPTMTLLEAKRRLEKQWSRPVSAKKRARSGDKETAKPRRRR